MIAWGLAGAVRSEKGRNEALRRRREETPTATTLTWCHVSLEVSQYLDSDISSIGRSLMSNMEVSRENRKAARRSLHTTAAVLALHSLVTMPACISLSAVDNVR